MALHTGLLKLTISISVFGAILLVGWPASRSPARAEEKTDNSRPVQATPRLGISGDRFAINGQPTFLLGASYYDGNGWKASDLDGLRDRQFNLIRIFMDLETIPKERTFLNSDGTLRNSDNLLSLVRACAARGIIVDVTILNPFSNQVSQESLATAVTNTVRLLKSEPNVFYDLCNEHNHDKKGISHNICVQLIDAAHAEDPSAIVTVSSAEYYGPHWLAKKSDTVVQADQIAQELDAGIQLAAPHFFREPGWETATATRVTAVRNHLASINRSIPIYLQEEARTGKGNGGTASSQFVEAAKGARDAGAAGWVFHTTAAFNLSGDITFFSKLDEIERPTVDALGPAVFGFVPLFDGKTLKPSHRIGQP